MQLFLVIGEEFSAQDLMFSQGYGPRGRKEWDTTERLSTHCGCASIYTYKCW